MAKPGRGLELSRRRFLQRTAATSLAGLAFPTIVPASVRGGAEGVAPGDKIAVALVGAGPQGQGVMKGFLAEEDARVVAVCDVKPDQRQRARELVNAALSGPGVAAYADFREVLARRDIDAVIIATPDHWHVLIALAAVRAGKDVYLEKPMGLSVAEDQALRAAVRETGRVFQFGTQQRSSAFFRRACEIVRNGRIGKLQHINVWCIGSVPGGSTAVVPVPRGIRLRPLARAGAVQASPRGPLLGRQRQEDLVVQLRLRAGLHRRLGRPPAGHRLLGRPGDDERAAGGERHRHHPDRGRLRHRHHVGRELPLRQRRHPELPRPADLGQRERGDVEGAALGGEVPPHLRSRDRVRGQRGLGARGSRARRLGAGGAWSRRTPTPTPSSSRAAPTTPRTSWKRSAAAGRPSPTSRTRSSPTCCATSPTSRRAPAAG